jgi:DNA-binding XRE family transcriptional regulator
MHRVEETLYRLAIGHVQIPTDIDPGDFILKGGCCIRQPILRRRRQAYLTREQLTERSGISVDSLQSLEQGRTCNPTAKTLLGLARSLNAPAADLINCIADDLEAEDHK